MLLTTSMLLASLHVTIVRRLCRRVLVAIGAWTKTNKWVCFSRYAVAASFVRTTRLASRLLRAVC